MREQFLWVEKYRPTKIEDIILPKHLKARFQDIVSAGEVPGMIFTGRAGIGKTTVAQALCAELDLDFMKINASDESGIDVVRTKIKQFASTVSLTDKRKLVMLDEADYLNPSSTQPALRAFMEEFARNTSFILTANFPSRVIEPLHSRCPLVEFKIPSAEKPALAGAFMKRLRFILDAEKVECSDAILAALIKRWFPDFRRILNELQPYALTGKVDDGVLAQMSEIRMAELMKALKNKEFSKVRTWVVNNLDADPASLFRSLYDSLYESLNPASIPQAILIIADYQYKAAFVADHEINTVACLVTLMSECEFK